MSPNGWSYTFRLYRYSCKIPGNMDICPQRSNRSITSAIIIAVFVVCYHYRRIVAFWKFPFNWGQSCEGVALFIGSNKVFNKTFLVREKRWLCGQGLEGYVGVQRRGEGSSRQDALPGPSLAPGRFNDCKRAGQTFTFLGHLAKSGLGQGRLKA